MYKVTLAQTLRHVCVGYRPINGGKMWGPVPPIPAESNVLSTEYKTKAAEPNQQTILIWFAATLLYHSERSHTWPIYITLHSCVFDFEVKASQLCTVSQIKYEIVLDFQYKYLFLTNKQIISSKNTF